jgi:hypothetical protein
MNTNVRRYAAILIPAAVLVLLVGGSALANKGFSSDHRDGANEQDGQDAEGGAAPSDKLLDKLVTRLGEAGIETDADTIAGLAETYGVGGAVRILAWADATGKDATELQDLRDSGMGWGQIAHQLNDEDPEGDLQLRPGIGWIMSGHGQDKAHGHDTAPGQVKKQQ